MRRRAGLETVRVVPADLPEVTAVDVIDLRPAPEVNRVSQYMLNTEGLPTFRIEGTEANRLADLWRRLPVGDQSRCHTPPFGLRFFHGEKVVQQASICWHCDNIFGDAEGAHLHFQFDSRAEVSRELLAAIMNAAGVDTL